MNNILEIPPGQVIIKQEEPGNGFYVLLSGNLDVYRDNVLLTSFHDRGTIFGEMSGILNEPRTSTIIARSFAKVVFVSSRDMFEFIHDTPDIGVKVIKTLAKRLVRTSKKFVSRSDTLSPEIIEMRGRRIKENMLDNIKGLGPARRRALDLQFETIDNLKNASLDELKSVEGIGGNMAEHLHSILHKL